MSDDPPCLALVGQLFPGRANDLARLAESNEAFRSLCEDYELAIGTLRQLEMQSRPRNAERIIEYRRLVVELERELSDTLNGETK